MCRGSRVGTVNRCLFLFREHETHREEEDYQWCRASVDELMLGTSGHDHEVPSFDILVFTSDGGFAYSGGKGQGLVDGVNLGEPAVSL